MSPFLGQAGSAATWDLTDAIDKGKIPLALEVLNRLMGAGEFHPLAVMGILHRHYQTMLRLDGAQVASADEAALMLGARSVYPVKKAMEQGRQMGSARLGRAVQLLAVADLDLRGKSALDDKWVMEVLIARLAKLSGSRDRSPSRR